ncbi:HAMP domain-containing methyl-accepting chemotaxis protein [Rhodoplanes sp. TEM]|uniref:HAMP domain-containing methyl-accepting chemotaxis protein n=1 Tax=Rhodoplanes tepidamans TaxID=200616 RepID=A0ABT5JH32_RHOTP|nr:MULTISPECIES: HAMP domain-containing methyl-accepting chemotaxis protein [Rhodoplanes]MDC7789028.1 HAMP domain-containing methyl-accepting chemotaxis protein [Rhodoplanes tepidamans]MDC7985957.1 HAMP domain-containing methyl-accepting chemotaxis protein [Rhodoplanes sp. TEM]MDQ0355262.1 methyl-accepting chemotaxis protein [Rhodoplanes tepidamans]
MSLLGRIKILPKILSVIVLLAAIAGFGAWYAAGQMHTVGSRYAEFLAKDAAARVTLTRTNRLLWQYEALVYKTIAETDDAQMLKLPPQIDKTSEEIGAALTQLTGQVPRYADRIEAARRSIEAIVAAGKPAIAAALRNDNAKAADLVRTGLDPLIVKQVASNLAFAQQLDEDITRGTETLAAATEGSILSTYLIIGVGVGVALAVAFAISQFGIARPIQQLTAGMHQLAAGNFEVVLAGLGRKDEVGEIAGAVEAFKIKAAEKAREEAAAQQEAERRAAEQRKRDMRRLADEFEGAVGEIIETVSSASTELEAAAGTLTRTAETTQQLSTRVAAASEQASANVQSVASATNEMAASVQEISRQVQESNRIADEAVRQAEKTDGRITELSQAANRIGDVVKLITAIAEQTNLLALNATIEAARAGEAGKGFAVVAQEVKALAAQTGKATGDISAQIAGMQAATHDSVSAIKEIGGTIGKIAEITATIAAAVEEQGAATGEIARNVQQASLGTTEVASNITQVDRGATETGSASSQVLSSAQSLSSESNRLKLEVGKFLETVRAA